MAGTKQSPRAEPAHTEAPLPPCNIEAEEHVLGAMMLAESAIERVVAAGLEAPDFYRESHGKIFRAALSLHQLAKPVDPITVAERLAELQQLDDVGGKNRIREIATLVPIAGSAGHHAEIIVREARRRQLQTLGHVLVNRAQESVDPDEIHAEAEELLAREGSRGAATEPLNGLTHAEVLELDLPEQRYLIDGLIPAGAAGTIAAVPESHKSWLAQAIAVRVAAGQGWVLGRQVKSQGPVGYVWQDDSTREEAERVKAFEAAHAQPRDLAITWFLNPGLTFPRDFARLRSTIQRQQLVLVVLDSLYNFLPGVDLKDDLPEKIIAQLKTEICDPTGCSVLVVDHMPWATEQNRSRLRAYGGVFKNAATRFGIYIDIVNDKIHIEARGNNITGFKSLAYWDDDDLELKLVAGNTDEANVKAPPSQIYDWIAQEGGSVEGPHIRTEFEIDQKTLARRNDALRQLGVEISQINGQAYRYTIIATADEQLAFDGAAHAGHQETSSEDPRNDTHGTEPPDSAGQPLRRSESAPAQAQPDTHGTHGTDPATDSVGSENGSTKPETDPRNPRTPYGSSPLEAALPGSPATRHPDDDIPF